MSLANAIERESVQQAYLKVKRYSLVKTLPAMSVTVVCILIGVVPYFVIWALRLEKGKNKTYWLDWKDTPSASLVSEYEFVYTNVLRLVFT